MAEPSGIRQPIDRIALAVATAGGAGLVPWMPGTAGALVGVGITVAAVLTGRIWLYVLLLAALSVAGVWAAGRVERIYGHDASRIVIDEVVGQMIALGFMPRTGSGTLATGTILGFLLFRFFDILKPFPIRRLERLPGGFGVMADDVGAGVYAFCVVVITEALVAKIL